MNYHYFGCKSGTGFALLLRPRREACAFQLGPEQPLLNKFEKYGIGFRAVANAMRSETYDFNAQELRIHKSSPAPNTGAATDQSGGIKSGCNFKTTPKPQEIHPFGWLDRCITLPLAFFSVRNGFKGNGFLTIKRRTKIGSKSMTWG